MSRGFVSGGLRFRSVVWRRDRVGDRWETPTVYYQCARCEVATEVGTLADLTSEEGKLAAVRRARARCARHVCVPSWWMTELTSDERQAVKQDPMSSLHEQYERLSLMFALLATKEAGRSAASDALKFGPSAYSEEWTDIKAARDLAQQLKEDVEKVLVPSTTTRKP